MRALVEPENRKMIKTKIKKSSPGDGPRLESVEINSNTDWSCKIGPVELNAQVDTFKVVSRKDPGLSLSWSNATSKWTFKKAGVEVAKLPGMSPPMDIYDFMKSHESEGLQVKKAARNLWTLTHLARMTPLELREIVSRDVDYGDPYAAFCALVSGADLSTPAEWHVDYPVAAALRRRCNEMGHARLTRSLAEIQGWFHLLEAFGGTLSHCDLEREGGLSTCSAGDQGVYGSELARQAVWDHGHNCAPALASLLEKTYAPKGEERALALIKFLAESGTAVAGRALREAGDPLFYARDNAPLTGQVSCTMDRMVSKLLSNGHIPAFKAACRMMPRIKAGWAFSSGVCDWIERERFSVCKGIKEAKRFETGLRDLMEAAKLVALPDGELGFALGYALAQNPNALQKAMDDAESRGGLAALDLSFIGGESVARGFLSEKPSTDRGAFIAALLMASGVDPDQLVALEASGDFLPQAVTVLSHHRAQRQAVALQQDLDAELVLGRGSKTARTNERRRKTL